MQTSECSLQGATGNSEEMERLYRESKTWSSISLLLEADERLKTFAGWSYPAVSPRDLAEDGFYALKDGDKVQCVFCNGRLGGWEPNDVPSTKHRRHYPECVFVRGFAGANVSLGKRDVPEKTWSSLSLLLEADERLKTFTGWSYPVVSPRELAENGFFALKNGDKVQCVSCNGILGDWEPNDVPKNEHQRHFPMCPFVRGIVKANVPLGKGMANVYPKCSTLYNGVGPVHKNYSNFLKRWQSFWNWNESLPFTPEFLAQCGFYYTGISDYLRCFSCDLGIRNVEKDESPLQVHQRCKPNCMFLPVAKYGPNRVKGIIDSKCDACVEKKLRLERDDLSKLKEYLLRRDIILEMVFAVNRAGCPPVGPLRQMMRSGQENNNCDILGLCIVCMEDRRNVVFLPCFHIVVCGSCSNQIENRCPYCREPIFSANTVYVP